MAFRPIGLTNVLRKPAEREAVCTTIVPLERRRVGNTSIVYVYVRGALGHVNRTVRLVLKLNSRIVEQIVDKDRADD